MFCTPDFDGLAALFCSGDGLNPLFFPDCHCSLFHVCLLNGFSRRGRVFLRPLSKIHSHSMERFSHWETGLGKYTGSWGAYYGALTENLQAAMDGFGELLAALKQS